MWRPASTEILFLTHRDGPGTGDRSGKTANQSLVSGKLEAGGGWRGIIGGEDRQSGVRRLRIGAWAWTFQVDVTSFQPGAVTANMRRRCRQQSAL
jgi:hypothetical protein